ncbi:MAG TPA: hypothetical protein VGY66_22845, partial [Gemmataceae bacterium]|nr:hypothetical protein [Gemmataceae bacterium]
MKYERKPWRRFVCFWMIFGYILAFGVRVSFWRTGLGFVDLIMLAIGAWIVWLIVSDLSKVDLQEEPARRWWQRRHHHKSKQQPTEHEQHGRSKTVHLPEPRGSTSPASFKSNLPAQP